MKTMPSTRVPLITEELREYLGELLGIETAEKYLKAITTPMEEYTLHIFQKQELAQEIIEKIEENGFKADQHPNFANLIITQPKGPFDVDYSEDLKEVIVDNRAAEMIYQGSDVFVPGVKKAGKVRENDFVQIKNQRGISVAKAKAMMSHKTILSKRKGIAAKNLESPYKVPSVPQLELEGYPVYFQSVPAYLTSLNLDPQPEDKILDCCAAPGNKTVHLSELSKGTGEIIAVDRSKGRLNHLEDKLSRFRIKNVKTVVGNIIELSKEWNVKFDKILVDPPCTALGLRPRLILGTDKKTIKATSDYQKAILFACEQLLKPGGELVYSTCTITKEENESVINQAIEFGLEIVDHNYKTSKMGSIDVDFSPYVQRFLPGQDRTLGYFIAKLKKSKS
ncbi:MAG: methyltransferase domain-containing protein [Candidatus Heimdallarchaeota archaeon]|nr:methyltransferase domain-containing protein [Candidatus Heimdallarchaeota archaeon]